MGKYSWLNPFSDERYEGKHGNLIVAVTVIVLFILFALGTVYMTRSGAFA